MLLNKYNLADWFYNTFSDTEQLILTGSYPDFTDPNGYFNTPSAAYFLANSLMFYNKKDNAEICIKVIAKIEELLQKEKNIPVNDLHFIYMHLINACYKLRDISAFYYKTIFFCDAQIKIAPDAVKTFSIIPEHTGYKQLCIIEKKNKNWLRVIGLCNAAMSQGWGGDWEKRKAEALKYL